MNNFSALILGALLLALPASAQLSPRLDPSFPLVAIYQPAPASGVLQLSSGARVVTGGFDRAERQAYNNSTSSGVVRYLPTGAPDSAFNATLAADYFQLATLAEAANGKLLLGLNGDAFFGGLPAPALVQLNADGTRDAAFANPVPGQDGYVSRIVVQPDGKLLVGGNLAFLGQTPAPGLARLNPDGTPDPSFQAQLASGRLAGVRGLALQPDGKVLVVANVELPGSPAASEDRLVRLQANGAQDLAFQPALAAGVVLSDVVVQPDGQVLLAGAGPQALLPGGTAALARFSAAGVADAAFAPPAGFYAPLFTARPALAVQPDGRILIANTQTSNPTTGHTPVARLLPSGALDPNWNVPLAPGDLFPRIASVQVLPTGQVLVAGNLLRLGTPDSRELGAALLEATGAPNPSFRPVLQLSGSVRDVAQQPDGRLVAVGNFSEVNDKEVHNVVRFELSGAVDTAFCRRARLAGGEGVRVLALPDGTLVAGGTFSRAGGMPQPGVVQLLPSGQPSAAFASPLTVGATLRELVRQPDGKLLVAGSLRRAGFPASANLLRLLPDGTVDATFQSAANVPPNALLVQPDGNIVVGSATAARQVLRLLPSGALDPSFSPPVLGASVRGTAAVQALALQPDGRLLLGGSFSQAGSVSTTHVARLLPNGTPDATFASQLLQPGGSVSAVALQPNGRVLLTGFSQFPAPAAAPSLFRLLPDGLPDASFASSQGPAQGAARVLVQADGAIVAAGTFVSVSGLPVLGLTRLLDGNVLAQRAATAYRIEAWPVPAHGQLSVRVGAVPPFCISLVNALGQVVQTQNAQTAQLMLDTEGLAPGLYLLRVEHAGVVIGGQRVETQ
ncbi:T9SS type A sorting domain-containing protein [Hymenobacter ruricola]|uniref:T9SS type A sorting domain-containing protein n=1 Tax=Hymenobacter ruricola TaxID=2791023 RepID=A0ABS0I0M9_9BACT|nr:T9SS type A sorting domain-containing protein [Hymenobacter ruricola]MBF9220288.1 T9SS type A sorting domain-containing protein [Hymenobacter ruricola]